MHCGSVVRDGDVEGGGTPEVLEESGMGEKAPDGTGEAATTSAEENKDERHYYFLKIVPPTLRWCRGRKVWLPSLYFDDMPVSVLTSFLFWTLVPFSVSVYILAGVTERVGVGGGQSNDLGLIGIAMRGFFGLQGLALVAQVGCFFFPPRSRVDKVLSWLALYSAALGLGAITGISFASMNASTGAGDVFQQLLNVALGVFFCVPTFVRRSLPRGFTRCEAECIVEMRAIQNGEGDGEDKESDAIAAELQPLGQTDEEGGPEKGTDGGEEGDDLVSQPNACGYRMVFARSANPEVNRVWWHHLDEALAKEEEEEKEKEGVEKKTAGCGSCVKRRVSAILEGKKEQRGFVSVLQDMCTCWWTAWACCRAPIAAASVLDFRRIYLAILMCLVFVDFTSDIAVGVQLTMAGVYEWSDFSSPQSGITLAPRPFNVRSFPNDLNPWGVPTPPIHFFPNGSFDKFGETPAASAYWRQTAAGRAFLGEVRRDAEMLYRANLTIPPTAELGQRGFSFFDDENRTTTLTGWLPGIQEGFRRHTGGFELSNEAALEYAKAAVRPGRGIHDYGFFDLGDFVLLPDQAQRGRTDDVADVGTIQVVQRKRARHIILRKRELEGEAAPGAPEACEDVREKRFWRTEDEGTFETLLESVSSNGLCLVGTAGVRHLFECNLQGCECDRIRELGSGAGKLLCPMGRLENFGDTFWCGVAVLFLALFDMLNVMVVQIILVNPKSFKRSWVRFLFSFLLSLTEAVIFILTVYGQHLVDNQDMAQSAFWFSIASTVLMILWKCIQVISARFNLCSRWRKIDQFLEREPPEVQMAGRTRKGGKGRKATDSTTREGLRGARREVFGEESRC
uniref:Transmembrane protein n=1 Tax=Chromera velia CCMP2878 TaxID=1169474 RepID=A0A0G4EZC8_9ALVE|eukprot:Cvel_2566.t1-p1 / transcript=Cvel_2566.t1 / gene=Cvel_2566 / organism=Chromera_velia_CCMP2878 / gene_product=hypothetical protein / transcript_product=hypothetical protein / location=Cvel_scaffold101:105840-108741(-) / protein_length=848 / sequence_SO=supercontig / SO=protein_coding / is_pseudo=false